MTGTRRLIWVTRPLSALFGAVAVVSLIGRMGDISFVGVTHFLVSQYRIVSGVLKNTLEEWIDIHLDIAVYDGMIFWLILASMNLSAVYLYFSRKHAFAREEAGSGARARFARADWIFLKRNGAFILANIVAAIALAPLYVLFALYKIGSGVSSEKREQVRIDHINARRARSRAAGVTLIGTLLGRYGMGPFRLYTLPRPSTNSGESHAFTLMAVAWEIPGRRIFSQTAYQPAPRMADITQSPPTPPPSKGWRRALDKLKARAFGGPAGNVFKGMATLAMGSGAARLIGLAAIPRSSSPTVQMITARLPPI